MNIFIFSLKVRQQQWKEEEAIRIANMPDPSVPPGHTLMPREERLQTLASLQKSKLHKFLLTFRRVLHPVFGSDNNKIGKCRLLQCFYISFFNIFSRKATGFSVGYPWYQVSHTLVIGTCPLMKMSCIDCIAVEARTCIPLMYTLGTYFYRVSTRFEMNFSVRVPEVFSCARWTEILRFVRPP